MAAKAASGNGLSILDANILKTRGLQGQAGAPPTFDAVRSGYAKPGRKDREVHQVPRDVAVDDGIPRHRISVQREGRRTNLPTISNCSEQSSAWLPTLFGFVLPKMPRGLGFVKRYASRDINSIHTTTNRKL